MDDTRDTLPSITHIADAEDVLDLKAVEAEIAEGARAMEWLIDHKTDTWTHWSIFIKGFRSFRSLVFAKAHTTDIHSYAYRQKIGELLQLKKYSAYARSKQERADCYALMDRIEDIDRWYAALPGDEQMRWNHPNSIKKNCPKEFVAEGRGHNKPPPTTKPPKKKPVTSVEIERLKALLIQVIKRLLKYEPDAAQLLDQLSPAEPNDDLEGI